jgi:DNA-dependent protein kinase catalytic subunit
MNHPAIILFNEFLHNNYSKNAKFEQVSAYLRLYAACKRETIESLIQKQYELIPADLLKAGIIALASSPEAFFTLRSRYARSLAVFNICSYVLGIGDRHLDNFLLDYTDGQILGIDFGHAFGSATEILPIPELMPFRLTRQLLHVMYPLSASNNLTRNRQEGMEIGGGLLKESMIHTMNALHMHQDILLNVMDVFIKEPLVDWLKNASMRQQILAINSEEESTVGWYPQRKIRLAKEKLNLMNPVHIVLEDIDANMHLKGAAKYIKPVVIGDKNLNVRAHIDPNERCFSIKHQVECLIDMATDPNILGRTYLGWGSHF